MVWSRGNRCGGRIKWKFGFCFVGLISMVFQNSQGSLWILTLGCVFVDDIFTDYHERTESLSLGRAPKRKNIAFQPSRISGAFAVDFKIFRAGIHLFSNQKAIYKWHFSWQLGDFYATYLPPIPGQPENNHPTTVAKSKVWKQFRVQWLGGNQILWGVLC